SAFRCHPLSRVRCAGYPPGGLGSKAGEKAARTVGIVIVGGPVRVEDNEGTVVGVTRRAGPRPHHGARGIVLAKGLGIASLEVVVLHLVVPLVLVCIRPAGVYFKLPQC